MSLSALTRITTAAAKPINDRAPVNNSGAFLLKIKVTATSAVIRLPRTSKLEPNCPGSSFATIRSAIASINTDPANARIAVALPLVLEVALFMPAIAAVTPINTTPSRASAPTAEYNFF